MGQRGRRRKQLLYELKDKRRYWKLKEALDRRLWGNIYIYRVTLMYAVCIYIGLFFLGDAGVRVPLNIL
jgi:hypothetical protein